MSAASQRCDVTVVTGAGSGIGAAVVEILAERGQQLAVLDRDQNAAERVAGTVCRRGGRAVAYHVDVSHSDQVDRAVDLIESEQGPITALANVAGVLRLGCGTELTDEDWAQTLAVNATGVFYVSRAIARWMVRRRTGAIVTVASNASGVPRARMAAYAASKAAARSFTHSLGVELGPLGIRCNVVAPGSTDTPMLRSMWTDDRSRTLTINGDPSQFRLGIPLGRLAAPKDVAQSVAFLLSDEARHITLATLLVDGGASLGVA